MNLNTYINKLNLYIGNENGKQTSLLLSLDHGHVNVFLNQAVEACVDYLHAKYMN
jgi:hypothetical protein